MKIAIDCRYLGKSGIGRVLEGIIENIDYRENKFFLIGKASLLNRFTDAEIIECDSDPFSVKGLFSFPRKINKICDALIVPNFIIPFGIRIPVVSIIHDLIFFDIKKMNKGVVDKLSKKFLLKRCVKKSEAVACVSNFTLKRCECYYPKYSDKFFLNYNGLSKSVLDYGKYENLVKNEKSIIYVGNVKPHKGLKTLIEAFKLLPDGYTLKIIGEKDNFITGFDDDCLNTEGVFFTGRLSDDELLREISEAGVLVQPSEYEGFGLPPLEALYLGTKAIVSDIEVFKEVYDGLDVDFFKVNDAEDLASKILTVDYHVKDCRKEITDRYDFKKSADILIDKVQKVIKNEL